MKKIVLIVLLPIIILAQTTLHQSKYKTVWYDADKEKTHSTWAAFDTSCIKFNFTTNNEVEIKAFDGNGNTIFYVDTTGIINVLQYIKHYGDADTYIEFNSDSLDFIVGGETFISIKENDSQDIIELGDGGDIDIKLSAGASGALTVSGSTQDVSLTNDLSVSGDISADSLHVNVLTVADSLALAGNIRLSASAYINWGGTWGSSGYGLRDNSGTIQVKNSGGSWADIPASAASAGGWTDDGTTVRLSTGTDQVAIGSATNVGDEDLYVVGETILKGGISASDGDPDSVFYINASGNVGIGTTGPGAKLHQQKLAADDEHILDVYSDNSGHTGRIKFRRSYQNTAGFTLNPNGSTLGSLEFYGVNVGSSAWAKAAEIRVTQDGSTGGTYAPGRIVFYTSDASSAPQERVRIDNQGNVGIGTTGPDSGTVQIAAGVGVHELWLGDASTYSYIDAGDANWTSSSDSSLKENFKEISKIISPLQIASKVLNVPVYRFNWKKEALGWQDISAMPDYVNEFSWVVDTVGYDSTGAAILDSTQVVYKVVNAEKTEQKKKNIFATKKSKVPKFGFLAQDFGREFDNNPNAKDINWGKVVSVQWYMIQELIKQVTKNKQDIANLEARVAALEK